MAQCIQPASYDVRLGTSFKYPVAGRCVDVRYPENFKYEEYEQDVLVLAPHTFVLATTMEEIVLPPDITAFVEGRSSIGRLGLFIQNAGWIDPGFKGQITLELYNASETSLILASGIRIAQIVFCKMDDSAVNPYNGKYQNQVGATVSKIFDDKDTNMWRDIDQPDSDLLP